jgi:hypothetical protein
MHQQSHLWNSESLNISPVSLLSVQIVFFCLVSYLRLFRQLRHDQESSFGPVAGQLPVGLQIPLGPFGPTNTYKMRSANVIEISELNSKK